LVIFLGAGLLSIPGSVMLRTPLRLFLDASLIPCVYYFAAKRSVDQPDFLPKIFIASWLAVLAMGGMGLYEGVSGRDLLRFEDETNHAEGTDDFRVNGPLGTAEQYGLVMSMLLLVVLVFKPMHNARLVRPWFLRLACLLAVGAVAYTSTRSVWLSLAAPWFVFQIRRRPVFALGSTALVLALGWFLTHSILPQVFGDYWEKRVTQEKTVYARIATYQSAFAMFKDHPLLGVGFGTFAENWERFPRRYAFEYKGMRSVSTPHNGFLAILSEMGLLGALAFLAFQIQIFVSAKRLSRVADGLLGGYYAEVAIAIAIAYMVAGLTLSFTYDTGFVNKIYFLVMGTLSGLVDGASRTPLDRTPLTTR
jgi:O-antigen ligase